MKFDCGLNRQEKALEYAKWLEWKKNRGWYRWFAWRPVRIGHRDCRWLEYLERKDTYEIERGWDGPCPWWTTEYRAKQSEVGS